LTILTVGSGQQYATIGAAVAASHDGDVVQIQAGTYVNDFAEINTKITLEGVGGLVHVLATTPPPDGKAAFTVNTDAIFDHFEISGVQVADLNGAAIRQQGGNLTVLDSYIHDNQMGMLVNSDPSATLTIRNSEFAGNIASGSTAASGLTHNLYVNDIARLVVDNSYFHDATLGHELKSRAAETLITNSRFADFDATASYSIDLPNGGHAVLSGNVIEQGAHSDNPTIIAFGEDGAGNGGQHANSSLTLAGNTVLNDLPGGLLLWNAAGAPVTMTDTQVWGLAEANLVSGPASITGTTHLSSEPSFNTAHPWQGSATPTDPGPGSVTPTDPGQGGATPTDPGQGSVTPTDPGQGSVTPTDPGQGGAAPTPTAPPSVIAGSDYYCDVLTGTAGADQIIGMKGTDLLTGGGGADDFVFRQGDGVDLIQDFHPGEDHLVFQGLDASQVTVELRTFGSVSLLDVTYGSSGDHVLLSGVTSLGASDLVFG
jgi:RTX calcium-binding nonapeptide repeat (4 copies)